MTERNKKPVNSRRTDSMDAIIGYRDALAYREDAIKSKMDAKYMDVCSQTKEAYSSVKDAKVMSKNKELESQIFF